MKKIAIAGATSCVGRALIQKCTKTWDILSVGRSPESDIRCDLSDPSLPRPLKKPPQVDCLIHCAASFGSDSWEGSIQNALVNSIGAIKVAWLAEQLSAPHVVYLSSIFSYEHEHNDYFNSYALSKRQGEENLRLLCSQRGIKFCSLRATQLYDEDWAAEQHQPLLFAILKTALKGAEFTIWGNEDPLRNFLIIPDLVQVIKRLVNLQIEGTYPCSHQQSHSLSEIAKMANDICGQGGGVSFDPSKPSVKSCHYPDSRELFKLIDYAPRTTLREGLELAAARGPSG